MAEKIAGGAWHEGGGGPTGGSDAETPRPKEPDQVEVDRLTAKRDNARWSAVVGFLMLFGASFLAAFAIGGALMIAYGVAASMYWSRRIRKLKGDPWAYDPELDGPRLRP